MAYSPIHSLIKQIFIGHLLTVFQALAGRAVSRTDEVPVLMESTLYLAETDNKVNKKYAEK